MSATPRTLRWLMPLGPVAALVVLGLGAPRQSRPERDVLGVWLTATTAPWKLLHLHLDKNIALPIAVAVFVLLWVGVAAVLAREKVSDALVSRMVALWAGPFVLGAPFLSRDVYAYVAQGELMRQGLDPYKSSPHVLGQSSQVLQAVDPMWRHATSPYGPLSLRIQQVAATAGAHHEWIALVVLRVVAVLSLLVAVHLVRRLVPPARRQLATWLAFNPLVVLQLVGAAHLEALLTALLLASVALAMSDRLIAATAVATIAVQVKATAAVVVIALGLHVVIRNGWHRALKMAATAVVTYFVSGFLLYSPDPFGWVHGLQTPTVAWNPFTPSSTLYLFVSEIYQKLDMRITYDVKTVARTVVVVAGLALVLVALRRARERNVAWTVAVTMTLASLSAPVVWPWYLAPCGLLLLAANRFAFATLLGTVPALAALPVPVVRAQRVLVVAEAAGTAIFAVAMFARRTGRAPRWAHPYARADR